MNFHTFESKSAVKLIKKTKTYKYFNNKLIEPLKRLLNEGITPHKLALSLVFGTAFGIIPVIGVTTALCLVIAFVLKLNKPAIILINFFVYPLQLLLLIPFIKTGEWLFDLGQSQLTISSVINVFKSEWFNAFRETSSYIFSGTIAWLIIMLPVSFIIYYVSKPVFEKYLKTK